MSELLMNRSDKNITQMSDKIVVLQHALKQISDAKRQLCRNTAEAKSRIQCNISRQLETLRNREVWLLNQLDVVSSAKEEVLQQQSARLNQTLGLLHSSVQYPNTSGDKINGLDLNNLQPEETPFVSFKSDPASLKEAIMNYGRIDPNGVPPMQSPFIVSDRPAPSLPKQFEDYHDAEHHILYKTVQEINWEKTNDPCVQVNIPKLSGKLDDWLLYPSTNTTVNSDPRFTFPQLSNNLSDWLRAPISVTSSCDKSTPMSVLKQECVAPLEGISTDASIKTWLHKIKQFPYEEDEEEDYDFVEEMSDVRTQCSGDQYDEDMDERWLHKSDSSTCVDTPLFKIQTLPMEKWLLKTEVTNETSREPARINMSQYLKSVTEELDKWLLNRSGCKTIDDSGLDEASSTVESARPTVPSTLNLQWRDDGSHISRIDNRWLQKSHSSGVRSHSSLSPASSRSSSMSRMSSRQNTRNKWLLKGGNSDIDETSMVICPFMDKYKRDIGNMSWLKNDKKITCNNENPLANFLSEKHDASYWLKPQKSNIEVLPEVTSPLEKAFEFQKTSTHSMWLLNPTNKPTEQNPKCFEKIDVDQENFWLFNPQYCLENDMNEEDLC
ncbi:Nuclear receptor coactivator 4 [Mactra antiquata]